jgi:hypothetical protein
VGTRARARNYGRPPKFNRNSTPISPNLAHILGVW